MGKSAILSRWLDVRGAARPQGAAPLPPARRHGLGSPRGGRALPLGADRGALPGAEGPRGAAGEPADRAPGEGLRSTSSPPAESAWCSSWMASTRRGARAPGRTRCRASCRTRCRLACTRSAPRALGTRTSGGWRAAATSGASTSTRPRGRAPNEQACRAFWADQAPRFTPKLDPRLVEEAVARAEGNLLYAVKLREWLEERPVEQRRVERLPARAERVPGADLAAAPEPAARAVRGWPRTGWG